jgi:hypothetical protein
LFELDQSLLVRLQFFGSIPQLFPGISALLEQVGQLLAQRNHKLLHFLG